MMERLKRENADLVRCARFTRSMLLLRRRNSIKSPAVAPDTRKIATRCWLARGALKRAEGKIENFVARSAQTFPGASSIRCSAKKGFTDRGKIARLKLVRLSLRSPYDYGGSRRKVSKKVRVFQEENSSMDNNHHKHLKDIDGQTFSNTQMDGATDCRAVLHCPTQTTLCAEAKFPKCPATRSMLSKKIHGGALQGTDCQKGCTIEISDLDIKEPCRSNQETAGVLTRSKRKRIANFVDGNTEDGNSSNHHFKALLPDCVQENADCGRQDNLDCGHHTAVKQLHNYVKADNKIDEMSCARFVGDDVMVNAAKTRRKLENIGHQLKPIQEGVPTDDEVCNLDAKKDCLLFTANAGEKVGRQMRPRPLDLEQPMPILIENREQDYMVMDIHGNSTELEQKPSYSISMDGKGKPIIVPSFRIVPDYDPDSHATYAMPQSLIKATHHVHGNQAEYDMDEEDIHWLKLYNQGLMHSRMLPLSEDQFEKIIDLLENKAAELELVNLIPAEAKDHDDCIKQGSEDCCICNGGENSLHNQLFKCAKCHIKVHQSCYGIKRAHPMNTWYCRKCEAVNEGKADTYASCTLCFKQGGALKQCTESDKWVHVVCALYTNETYFVNPDAMEPVDGIIAAKSRMRKQRRRCRLCGLKEGSAEGCSVPTCATFFHVSCGVQQGAFFQLQHHRRKIIRVKPFCPEHATVDCVSSMLAQAPNEKHKDKRAGLKRRFVAIQEDNEKRSPSSYSTRRKRFRRIRKRKRVPPRKDSSSSPMHAENDLDTASAETTTTDDDTGSKDTNDKNHGAHSDLIAVDSILRLTQLPETDIATRESLEAVYWYWVSKRKRVGGPLLFHIQQEWAVEYFGIFNPSSIDEDTKSPQDRSLRHTLLMKRRVVSIGQWLYRLQELANLVIKRERLKLDICLVNQEIIKVGLHVIKSRGRNSSTFVNRAFWESLELHPHPKKTALVSQLLKKLINNGHEGTPKKHPLLRTRR